MPLPLKPGESPESLIHFAEHIQALMKDGYRNEAVSVLRAFGDRRGEEERAKALADVIDILRTVAASGGDDDLPRAIRRIRSLAAAPSGDAKGTAQGGTCPDCGHGWPHG